MASYPLGTKINFRYTRPTYDVEVDVNGRRKNVIKMVFVLTSNYNGNMHALDIFGMSPEEQTWLQFIFDSDAKRRQTGNPIQVELDQQIKQLEIAEQRKQELLNTTTQTVIKPDPTQVNKTFGTSTFKRTPTIGTAAKAVKTVGRIERVTKQGFNFINSAINKNFNVGQLTDAQIQNELKSLGIVEANTKKNIDELRRVLGVYESLNQSGFRPGDPYTFYHMFLKPHYGNTASRFYRKYNAPYVEDPRIIRIAR